MMYMALRYQLRYVLFAFIFVASFLMLAPDAMAKGSFYVDSAAGNNANSCQTATKPCRTIAAVNTKIAATSDPSNSTVYLKGTFTEQVRFDGDAGTNFKGLRLTAWNTNIKPLIDGTGLQEAVLIDHVNNLRVDNLRVANSIVGMDISGDGQNPLDGLVLKNNLIFDLTNTDSGVIGLMLDDVKNATVEANTIKDSVLSLTDAAGSDTVTGMYISDTRDSLIKGNTISNIRQINTASVVANTHTSTVYGMRLSDTKAVVVRKNNITKVSATETSPLNNANQTAYVYGLYSSVAVDNVIRGNTIDPTTATVTLDGTSTTGMATAYGMYLTSSAQQTEGKNTVFKNKVLNQTATAQASTGSSYLKGVSIYYARNLDVYENKFKIFSSTTSSINSTLNSYLHGIDGPYLSSNVTVRDNTISGLTTSTSYSSNNSQSNQWVYGIASWGSPGTTILRNKVRGLSSTASNGNGTNADDSVTQYGILLEYDNNAIVKKNTSNNYDCNISSAGLNGGLDCNQYGLYLYESDNSLIGGNVLYDQDANLATTDATNASDVRSTYYGLFVSKVSNTVVRNNKIRDSKHVVSGSGTNTAGVNSYPLRLSYAVNTTVTGNKVYGQNNVSGSTGTNKTFGIYVNKSHGSTLQGNKVWKMISAMNGAAGSNYVAGLYVSDTQPLYLNGNMFRNFTSTSNASLSVYGAHFDDDGSELRAYNNIFMGKANDGADENTGVKFDSKTTDSVHMVNNTIAKWRTPLYIQGGKNYKIINNIFFAAGTDSYGLRIGRNNTNNKSLNFKNNLYYNSSSSSKNRLIYDSDNATAIHFGDWKNPKGSYGYDKNSINKRAYLTSKGHLKKDSKARDKGTKTFGYKKTRKAYKMLQTDFDGQKRPYPTWLQKAKNLVDIGADEFKTKKKNKTS